MDRGDQGVGGWSGRGGRKIDLGGPEIPRTMRGILETLDECLRDLLPGGQGKDRARLETTAREVGLVLAEMRDGHGDRDRPIYPRIVRIFARLIEDDLL